MEASCLDFGLLQLVKVLALVHARSLPHLGSVRVLTDLDSLREVVRVPLKVIDLYGVRREQIAALNHFIGHLLFLVEYLLALMLLLRLLRRRVYLVTGGDGLHGLSAGKHGLFLQLLLTRLILEVGVVKQRACQALAFSDLRRVPRISPEVIGLNYGIALGVQCLA